MPEQPSIVDTWERLVRFHRLTTKAMDAHLREQFGRTLDDYDVLHQINVHTGPIQMGELAERLLVANSSCHRIVERLVDAGLMERSAGTQDRREVFVDLTAAGRRLWRRMAAVHTRDIEAHVGVPLTGSQHRELREALGSLLAGADSVTRGPEPL
ncbi:MAG: MarR family winged helix-turn-helix transcriptional regulator [Acidimicrobiales bacterium]